MGAAQSPAIPTAAAGALDPSDTPRKRLTVEAQRIKDERRRPRPASIKQQQQKKKEEPTAQDHNSVRDTRDVAKETTEQTAIRGERSSPRRGTEVLRERSGQRQRSRKGVISEGNMAGREGKGRNFTVANVGNNGLIYLRPMKRVNQLPSPQSPTLATAAPAVPAGARSGAGRAGARARDSVWTQASTTPASEAWSSLRRRRKSHRSLSESIVDDKSMRSAREHVESGAFKVVIERAGTVLGSDDEASRPPFPTLDIPIPHYRLGSPRFSNRGTAFLQSSVYTASSSNVGLEGIDLLGDILDRVFQEPAILPTPSADAWHVSPQLSTQSSFLGSELLSMAPLPPGPYRTKDSISPQIYDTIAADPDDPAIVKYSPATGDIIAATPARIIVQVTSESFLNYELLSDFFLTVRCYLPTHDLLAYLLARFEWAINRFDDNGRVIRVRAFAALRHWILNYFSYDFVVDRPLRERFCDRLNALTQVVRARADYGASDMKLIADLKKCWNGRCLLYWDNLPDSPPDVDIHPGGIVGSRNSHLVHQSQLRSGSVPDVVDHVYRRGSLCASSTTSLPSGFSESACRQAQGHNRQGSTATCRTLPTSRSSEISAPVLSCSFPAKSIRKAIPYAHRALGLHPMPTDGSGRRACPAAPSSQANSPIARPFTAHRRSGSFSDAARDKRAPLSSEMPESDDDFGLRIHFGGSLVRGNIFPPSSPYVTVLPATSARRTSHPPLPMTPGKDSEASGHWKVAGSGNPAMKNLMGNIRRVLSSKAGGGGASPSLADNAFSFPPPLTGKHAPILMNVFHKSSPSRSLESERRALRVDLLALGIVQAYQEATKSKDDADANSIGIASGNERNQPSPFGVQSGSNSNVPLPPQISRLPSGMTTSSHSIVIVDDTGLESQVQIPPLPRAQEDCGLKTPRPASPQPGQPVIHVIKSTATSESDPLSSATADFVAGQAERQIPSSLEASQLVKDRKVPAAQIDPDGAARLASRPSMTDRDHPFGASFMSLRRYASFQSAFNKHAANKSIDTTSASVADSGSDSITELLSKAPVRGLRRIPGGDLRAHQNIQDLEDLVRPKSTGSITTHTDSVRSSELLSFGDRITRTFQRRAPVPSALEPVDPEQTARLSYIRTHSSQPGQRRPSFEAAVAGFAHIPDDDEGGIEATLLKLEGRYQRSPPQSPHASSLMVSTDLPDPEHHGPGPENKAHWHGYVVAGEDAPTPLPRSPSHPGASAVFASDIRETVISTVYAESEDSSNSVPLLERGGADENVPGKGMAHEPSDSCGSTERSSTPKLRHGSTTLAPTTSSFILPNFDGEVFSRLSMQAIDDEEPAAPSPASDKLRPSKSTVTSGHHPPTPPLTMASALSIGSEADQVEGRRNLPTPDQSPARRHTEPHLPVLFNSTYQTTVENTGPQARHICFVLGCDSVALAQQFTLVERDALKEVDWRDLVDMKWQHSATTTTNWVDYLLREDPGGVDLISARFNIMVKWCLSQIVLTENVEERVSTIVKYIHIAQQARLIHNYATMFQFAIALTSKDCTRLKRTWELVPAVDRETLRDLERLVSPLRNFHNLRAEMDRAGAEQGCIPIVALYVHDLTTNSAKPATIPGPSGSEPLVNFERYRSTAVIVKSLLRLIDASSKYDYKPVQNILSPCLWVSCLPDEVITQKSEELEAVDRG